MQKGYGTNSGYKLIFLFTEDMKNQKARVVIENKEEFVRQLMLFLQDIEGKWKEFATALEISSYIIDNINADCFRVVDNAECCREMFALWQRSTKRDKRTWFMIKKAARTLSLQNLIEVLEDNCVNGMMVVNLVH